MQPLLYANLSKKTLSETQSGSSISWPRLVAGEDLVLKLRLVQSLDGQVIAARRTISTLKASIGEKDARPLDGAFQLRLGTDPEAEGVNTTSPIAFDATAQQFAAALNALSDPALGSSKPFACTLRDGSYLVRAADGGQLSFSVADNELWPVSFVAIREFSYDEGHSYEFRLTQAPVAETTSFNSIVPEIPSVTTIQSGSENSGVKINEIQRLFVPPDNPPNFSFRLTLGFKKSDPIVLPTTPEEILAALAPLADADAGEEFRVYPGQDAVLIEFRGEAWSGVNQDQLGVEVVDEAPADPTFTLATATAEMAVRIRRPDSLGEIKLPLELTLGLEDEQDEQIIRTIKFRADLVFLPPVNQAAFSAAAALNWNQPLSRESYLQFSPSQVATGQRHYLIPALGDGLSDQIQVNHNLNTRHLLVQLQQAAVDGFFLVQGSDYQLQIVSDNAIKLIFPGGAPGAASLIGQISSAAHDANFEPHTHTIGQIEGLEERLSAAEGAIAELQAMVPLGQLAARTSDDEGEVIAQWTLARILELYPAREWSLPVTPAPASTKTTTQTTASGTSTTKETVQTGEESMLEVARLVDIPLTALPKDGGLLPAIHDGGPYPITTEPPAPGVGYKGRVAVNNTGAVIRLSGGRGRRSVELADGEYAGCDGSIWFKVAKADSSKDTYYPTDFERELFLIAVNDQQLRLKKTFELNLGFEVAIVTSRLADGWQYLNKGKNTRVQWQFVLEHGTFGPESTSPVEMLFSANSSTNQLTIGGTNDMEGILLNSKFRVRSDGTLPGGLAADTDYYLKEYGEPVAKLSATPGGAEIDITSSGSGQHYLIPQLAFDLNLKQITWNATPLLKHTFFITREGSTHTFGCRIGRSLVASVDTITAEKILYGAASVADSAPASANFALRGRLTRFDIEDVVAEPRALVALLGLNVSPATAAGSGAASSNTFGLATIS